MTLFANRKIHSVILILIAVVVYFPVIFSETIVNPDAQFIVPILESLTGPKDYLLRLISLNTLDFQPIRDLSLLIDFKVYEFAGINISVAHNVLLWIISCFIISKIVRKVSPSLSDIEIFSITAGFVCYPLFVQSVSWGVARKHLLAFLFSLLFTNKLIGHKGHFSYRDILQISFFYLMAVLSQPISLPLALWAIIYLYFQKDKNLKNKIFLNTPLVLIFISLGFTNYLYYSASPVFLSSYGLKTNEIFEVSDKILALGHYFFQIFFPYSMAFTYTLGHWSTLAGLIIMGVFIYLLLGLNVDRKQILIWLSFSLLPISVVIIKSTQLYDTYLLIPSLGVLILFLLMKENLPSIKGKYYLYGIAILGWICFSHYESSAWTDEVTLTHRSFERRPTCLTAYEYLRMSYENDHPPSDPSARQFLYHNVCEKFQIMGINLINLQAYMLYYEQDLPEQMRLEKLQHLSNLGIMPHMALAALYLKFNQKDKAEETIHALVEKWGSVRYKPEYIHIATKILKPFCDEIQNEKCLNLLKPFQVKESGFSYK